MIRLCERLALPRGMIAVVGGGGKTSLINRLCSELSLNAKVLRMTTTRMYPPEGEILLNPSPEVLRFALKNENLITVGSRTENGKLGPPQGNLCALASLADYTLMEADGSRGLPLKAPAEHEPAVPENVSLVLAVAGVSAIGRPIAETAHRPERYAALIGKTMDAVVEPDDVAFVLQSANGQRKNVAHHFVVILNQCDSLESIAKARKCAALIENECVLLSLKGNPNFYEIWRNGHACSD